MTALRKELHEYVDRVDENFLRVLRAMIKEHLKTKPEEEVVLSNADLKEISRRKSDLVSGKDPGIEADELSKNIRSLLKKRRK